MVKFIVTSLALAMATRVVALTTSARSLRDLISNSCATFIIEEYWDWSNMQAGIVLPFIYVYICPGANERNLMIGTP
ncbi:hypothetical protein BDW42DRAFT_45303 [Aspergillus taichungensis]|uniref:Uncharacterized protein n=1 Tax=Aspergillus taichungensis TaxID=482145 RepID=A0A2J5I381_9EURO|nr:hypothetical protein BDW42DRAFT_45303 [Aspergillus taichungensis]